MRRLLAPTVALAALVACGGGADARNRPWTTAVDSTGDTIRVRIAGGVPDALVKTLVPDLTVGQVDGADELTFGRIGGMVVGRDGTMYVYDAHQTVGLIRLYSPSGEFIRTLGAKGGGPGEYGQINGFALAANGDLVLWDASGGRINRYAADGSFLESFRVPVSGMFTSNGVHVSRDGVISIRSTIGMTQGPTGMVGVPGAIRLNADGSIRDSLAYPKWRDADSPVLFVESPDGRMRTIYSIPFQPGPVTTTLADGGFAGGFSDRYVFQIWPKEGKPIQVTRDIPAVPVAASEQSEYRAQIEQGAKRTNPNFSWTGPGIPTTKPAYQSILVDDDGRLWVRVSQPGEPIPEAEMPPVRTDIIPAPVRITTRDPVVYDVYSPTGELLGRLRMPRRTTLLRARGDFAWGISRDEDDVEFATRFRIEPGWRE